jgi:hypothetical protein
VSVLAFALMCHCAGAATEVVAVDSVQLSPASVILATGDRAALTAKPFDANGASLTGRRVTWTSSNPAAVTVSDTGLLTGVAPGSATINAEVGGKKAAAVVTIVTPFTFTTLTVGAYHNCGVVAGGAAYCWGMNQYGQLGDGTTTDHSQPVLVAGGISFSSISAGHAKR